MQTHNVNGIELALLDRGSGPAVVLVHGFPLDHTMWDAQIDPLAENHRPIVPDLRGFGQSGVTEGVVTMEQFADDLAAMLDALNVSEPVALCGLSMGGYIVFQFWRKYPARVRGLMLCDTRALTDTPEMAVGRLEMADRIVREGPEPLIDGMMPKLFAEETIRERPEVAESLRRVMLSHDRQGIAAAGRGMAERPDVTSMLAQIDCPTLVVVGQFDAISTPDEMRAIAGAIPGSQLVEIAGSGHMSPMEKPAEFNRAMLEFLATLP